AESLKPSSQSSVTTNPTTSLNCHSTVIRQRGRASATSGTSHTEYCGLHTFVVNRKATTARKANCANRGRNGAIRPSIATPINAASSTTATAKPGGDQPGA